MSSRSKVEYLAELAETGSFPQSLTLGSSLENVRRIAVGILKRTEADGLTVELTPDTSLADRDVLAPFVAAGTLVTLPDAQKFAEPWAQGRLRSLFRAEPIPALRFFAAVPVVTADAGGAGVRFGSLLLGDAKEARDLTQIQESALVALGRQIGNLLSLEAAKQHLETENLRLSELATTDGLTALANRRAFGERLAAAITYSRQTETPLSLILLDVDRFKSYNDLFGHPAGDEVLRQVGRILGRVSRDSDLPARYGGEEFAVILSETDGETGAIIADLFRSEIEGSSFPHREITASFGVAEWTPYMANGGDLVAAADTALYQSKASGRNQVTLAGS